MISTHISCDHNTYHIRFRDTWLQREKEATRPFTFQPKALEMFENQYKSELLIRSHPRGRGFESLQVHQHNIIRTLCRLAVGSDLLFCPPSRHNFPRRRIIDRGGERYEACCLSVRCAGSIRKLSGGTGERRGPGGPVPGPVPQSGLRGTAAARRRGHPGPPSGNGVLSDRLLCPVPAAHSGDLPGTPGPERPLGRDPAGYPRPPAATTRRWTAWPRPYRRCSGPRTAWWRRRSTGSCRCWGSSGTRSARAMACAGRTPPGQRPCLPISLH